MLNSNTFISFCTIKNMRKKKIKVSKKKNVAEDVAKKVNIKIIEARNVPEY